MPSLTKAVPTPSSASWLIQSRLKTRQLLLLRALDEEGNIQRAAASLHMTQPAASKLIKELEDALGVALFERHARGMRPTWYGESLIRHTRMAIANLQDAHEEIHGLKSGRRGLVRIGAINTPAITLLPAVALQLRQQQLDLNLSIQIESSDVLVEQLSQGRLDIVIGRLFPNQAQSNLRLEPLASEPICAMVSPSHPLLKVRRKLKLSDLTAACWIVPPVGSVLRHRFEQMFQTNGLHPPTHLIETTSILFTTKMLSSSDDIAITSNDVVDHYQKHGMATMLPIRLPCEMEKYGLVTRTDRLLSPGATRVLEQLRSTALSLHRADIVKQ